MRVFITIAIILGGLQSVEGQYVLTPESLFEHTKSAGPKQHHPMISPEGDRLVFGSTIKSQTSYYQITRNENGWTTPNLIKSYETFNKPALSTYGIGFNGESLFFSSRERHPKNEYTDSYYRLNLIDDDFGIPFKVDIVQGVDLGNPYKGFHYNGSEHYFNSDYKLTKTIPNALPKEFGSELIGVLSPIAIGENAVLFQKIDPKKKFKLTQEELYFSIRIEDKWSHPNNLTMKGLEKEVIRGYSFSEKTNEIFFSTKKGGIYSAKLPKELSDQISTDYSQYIRSNVSKNISSTEPRTTNSKYYALLIGIEDYKYNQDNLVDLSNPIGDAHKFKEELIENYTFEPSNITTLKNPDRADIINSFEKLSAQLTENDNLLIFYAGHGVWDEKLNIGYWLSSDASTESKANWISNSTVRDYIAGLNTKHTLLISDACFSGSIFKTREVGKSIDDYGFYRLNKLPSRKAMTSGTLNTVPDDSKFMKYLLKALAANEKEYFPSKQLFHEIEIAIINNTANVPQFGTIQNTGDEGGDFIFIKREKE